MTEKIEQLINELRSISLELKQQLATERALSSELRAEIEGFKTEIANQKNAINALEARNSELLSDLESMKNNSTAPANEKVVSKEEIDELVNEIEYCITQLKH